MVKHSAVNRQSVGSSPIPPKNVKMVLRFIYGEASLESDWTANLIVKVRILPFPVKNIVKFVQ
jgi:hypothetical protein